MQNSENIRVFESLAEVTLNDVQWLKDGSVQNGYRIQNGRTIYYITARGIEKAIKCFVMSDGTIEWYSWTARGNASRSLTNEEAKVFDYEKYAKRMERKQARKAKQVEAMKQGHIPQVGDIFSSSYGYDATLWSFYEVVEVSKTGKTVKVREVHQQTAPGYGYNDWKCRPSKGDYMGETQTHKVKYSTWSKDVYPYFTVNSYASAYYEPNPEKWHEADNYH